jgi:hypothetical protein
VATDTTAKPTAVADPTTTDEPTPKPLVIQESFAAVMAFAALAIHA